ASTGLAAGAGVFGCPAPPAPRCPVAGAGGAHMFNEFLKSSFAAAVAAATWALMASAFAFAAVSWAPATPLKTPAINNAPGKKPEFVRHCVLLVDTGRSMAKTMK